jgi:hypothetical protein
MNMVSSRGGLVDEIKGGEKNPWSHDGITTFSPIKTIEFVRGWLHRLGHSIKFEQPTQSVVKKDNKNTI